MWDAAIWWATWMIASRKDDLAEGKRAMLRVRFGKKQEIIFP